MGFAEYEVAGDGAPYRVEVRRSADEYERSIYNGTEADWQREVIPSIGLLRRMYNASVPIPDAVISAFNAWREAEHARVMSEIRDRYGSVPDIELSQPPPPVRGGVYEVGTGWIVNAGDEAVVQA